MYTKVVSISRQPQLKPSLLLIALLMSFSVAHAADDALPTTPSQNCMTNLQTRLETLVRKYYPKAKVIKTKSSMHFQYKVRQYDIPQTNTIEPGPEWSGILGDIEMKDGRLNGEDTIEKKLNQYSYYNVIELQPNSPRASVHLKTRLAYPFDVQPEFLQNFKTLIRNFDSPEQPAITE